MYPQLKKCAKEGSVTEMKAVVEDLGVDVILKFQDEEYGRTALHLACLHNKDHEDVAIYLMDIGCKPYIIFDYSKCRANAIMYACGNGLLKVVEYMLENDTQVRDRFMSGTDRDEHRNTALHYVLQGIDGQPFSFTRGHQEVFKLLMRHCDRRYINDYNNDNDTPMSLVIKSKQFELILELDKAGCMCVDHATVEHISCLQYCIRYPVCGEFQDFIEASPGSLTHENILQCFNDAANLDVPTIKTKCDESFETSGVYNTGRRQYRMKCVQCLLPYVTNKTFVMNGLEKDTLQISYEAGFHEMTEMLVEHGAKIQLQQPIVSRIIQTKCLGNLLHGAIDSFLYAYEEQNTNLIDDIINKFGKNMLEERNSRGRPPLHYIIDCPVLCYPSIQRQQLLRLPTESSDLTLIQSNATTNNWLMGKSHMGSYAFEQRQYKLIKHLLQHGAQVNSQDNEEYTPIIRAVKNQDHVIASLLMTEGANPTLATSTGINACILTQNDQMFTAILNKDTGVRNMDTDLPKMSEELIKKILLSFNDLEDMKTRYNVSQGDLDMMKKAQLTMAKLAKPALTGIRRNVQQEVLNIDDIKQEICNKECQEILLMKFKEDRVLSPEESEDIEGLSDEVAGEQLVTVLSHMDPDRFDALMKDLAEEASEDNILWNRIIDKCDNMLYDSTIPSIP